jgi:hypothetical protein
LPLRFQSADVDVKPGKGRKEIERSVDFGPEGSLVRNAGVALSGYRLDFLPPGVTLGGAFGGSDPDADTDHHINVVEAETWIVGSEGNTVTFMVACEYQDRNGDDSYGGWVGVTVIADVEPPLGSSASDQSAAPA